VGAPPEVTAGFWRKEGGVSGLKRSTHGGKEKEVDQFKRRSAGKRGPYV